MLVTETTATGSLIKDYIWQGMMPIAQIDNTVNTDNSNTESIVYLYTDHLMTNRLATNQTQAIVWRWEGDAFGNTPAQELASMEGVDAQGKSSKKWKEWCEDCEE